MDASVIAAATCPLFALARPYFLKSPWPHTHNEQHLTPNPLVTMHHHFIKSHRHPAQPAPADNTSKQATSLNSLRLPSFPYTYTICSIRLTYLPRWPGGANPKRKRRAQRQRPLQLWCCPLPCPSPAMRTITTACPSPLLRPLALPPNVSFFVIRPLRATVVFTGQTMGIRLQMESSAIVVT